MMVFSIVITRKVHLLKGDRGVQVIKLVAGFEKIA
jgi:hypothetical protein